MEEPQAPCQHCATPTLRRCSICSTCIVCSPACESDAALKTTSAAACTVNKVYAELANSSQDMWRDLGRCHVRQFANIPGSATMHDASTEAIRSVLGATSSTVSLFTVFGIAVTRCAGSIRTGHSRVVYGGTGKSASEDARGLVLSRMCALACAHAVEAGANRLDEVRVLLAAVNPSAAQLQFDQLLLGECDVLNAETLALKCNGSFTCEIARFLQPLKLQGGEACPLFGLVWNPATSSRHAPPNPILSDSRIRASLAVAAR